MQEKNKNQENLQFVAEIKEVKSRKTSSLDIVYRLVVESNDPTVLSLGFISPDTTVRIAIEPND